VAAQRHGGGLRRFLRERRTRGEEFARLRMAEEKRSRVWAALDLLALPAIPSLDLARVGRLAIRSAWTWSFVRTLPLQLAANAAWAFGEARTQARIYVARVGIGSAC
jgi:hypothetical protein